MKRSRYLFKFITVNFDVVSDQTKLLSQERSYSLGMSSECFREDARKIAFSTGAGSGAQRPSGFITTFRMKRRKDIKT
jgi:hypothetical protein